MLQALQSGQAFGRLKSSLFKLRPDKTRDKLCQAQISIFRQAMTFFIRLSQPNKTSVYVCVSLPALLNFSQKTSEADLTGVAK